MIVIVSGTRHGREDVESYLTERAGELPFDCLIEGGARGVDTQAGDWALRKGIPNYKLKAPWTAYGKGAGYRRNSWMIDLAHALDDAWRVNIIAFAFPAPDSKGTIQFIELCHKNGIQVINVNETD